jgi:hypothetical protein
MEALLLSGQETPLVRMSPKLPSGPSGSSEAAETPQEELQKGVQEEQDPFVLSPSTAPAQSKRARGPTLDFKAMHEGRQMAPKRDK